MKQVAAIAAAYFVLSGSALAEVDYVEIWHACDDAAADAGFYEAGLLAGDLRGSTVKQVAGQWEGQTLHIIIGNTSTGTVFCMTDEDAAVVHYKFDGVDVIGDD